MEDIEEFYMISYYANFYVLYSGVAVYGISKGIGLSISMDKDLMKWSTPSSTPIITTPNSTNASYVGDPHIWQVQHPSVYCSISLL